MQAVDGQVLTHAPLQSGRVSVDPILQQMVDAAQLAPHAYRPGDRRGTDAQHFLDLIEQLDRRTAVAVELVDEGHDRCVAQAADLHQLDRALLDAFRAVDDHQSGIDSRQGPIRVLGEVLVAGRIQQIDDAVAIGKLHYRGRDGNSALLLQPHPVRSGVPGGFATLDGARHLDGAAEQQQLLGERRLARVGVTDNREGASSSYFPITYISRHFASFRFCT